MKTPLDPALNAEMRNAVRGLLPYKGGPGVDYTHSAVAYVANITLIHDPAMRRVRGRYMPTAQTTALVAQRGSGDWYERVWGGVSGYIDTMYDPDGEVPDEQFDPVLFTARAELETECGMSPHDIDTVEMHMGEAAAVELRMGERFKERRFKRDGILHVIPLLGVCGNEQRPDIAVDGKELIAYEWVPLGEISRLPDDGRTLSPGYLESTLPAALGSLHLNNVAIQGVLYPRRQA